LDRQKADWYNPRRPKATPGYESQAMKPSRRTRRHLGLLLTFAVFAHFGLGHRDVPAFVLCFGADGHVAVEPVRSPHAPGDRAAVAAHATQTGAQAETA
jgi:hypothetical protein